MTEDTISTKWSYSYISSRKVMKFVYLRKNSNITVLNMVYKLDLNQPKQEVFWHLTYSRPETSNAWKIPHEVMKFVYLLPTYFLSVLIIGPNITCTKFWILWICTVPTSYLNSISTQNMTRAKWWNTCIVSQHLGTFIKPVRDEEKPSQDRLWIWHAAAWASS